jgi:hypothetical protein
MSAHQGGTDTASATVLVRFRDNEILEGEVSQLDFNDTDIVLTPPPRSCNNKSAIIPLAAIKTVLIERRDFRAAPDAVSLRKVAIRFWDGDVLKGFIEAEPVRHRNAMTMQLISPGLDEVDVYGLPYTAVKGIFFIKAWDGRPPVYTRETGHWTLTRSEAPLLDLLGEIRSLTSLRTRGEITLAEFERRRREVLDRI